MTLDRSQIKEKLLIIHFRETINDRLLKRESPFNEYDNSETQTWRPLEEQLNEGLSNSYSDKWNVYINALSPRNSI